MKPIKGMTKEPYGLPMMLDAWLGCLHWAIGKDEIRAQFKSDTGKNLESLVGATAFEKMIDKATGYDRELFAAFADWVTINFWGDDADPEGLAINLAALQP